MRERLEPVLSPRPRVPAAARAMSADGEQRYRLRCIDKLGVQFRGNERLLDAGCGNGGVARILGRLVEEVVAVDVQESPDWSRADPNLTFQVASAERLPFEDGSFDVVHSKDSLHHMDSPERALAEYRRVLRPRGTVIVVEGNRYNPVFYPHLTLLHGHQHFSQSRFRSIVSAPFPDARFGRFEAHYVPGPSWLLPVQHVVEELLERFPPFGPLLSYNFAVASASSLA